MAEHLYRSSFCCVLGAIAVAALFPSQLGKITAYTHVVLLSQNANHVCTCACLWLNAPQAIAAAALRRASGGSPAATWCSNAAPAAAPRVRSAWEAAAAAPAAKSAATTCAGECAY
jgi:hypothetical protein